MHLCFATILPTKPAREKEENAYGKNRNQKREDRAEGGRDDGSAAEDGVRIRASAAFPFPETGGAFGTAFGQTRTGADREGALRYNGRRVPAGTGVYTEVCKRCAQEF